MAIGKYPFCDDGFDWLISANFFLVIPTSLFPSFFLAFTQCVSCFTFGLSNSKLEIPDSILPVFHLSGLVNHLI